MEDLVELREDRVEELRRVAAEDVARGDAQLRLGGRRLGARLVVGDQALDPQRHVGQAPGRGRIEPLLAALVGGPLEGARGGSAHADDPPPLGARALDGLGRGGELERRRALHERVRKLAAEFGSTPVLRCDVTRDDDIAALFESLRGEWGGLDGLLHAIAFAPREALAGDYLNGLSREAFAVAHDVSSYSLAALAKGARPLMQERHAAMVTLTYLGAVRAMPNYNVMGVAKAALESSVRYLAADLGANNIRVNAISAGPIKTLAASGIGDFRYILKWNEYNTPLRRNVTLEDVGKTGVYFLSDMSSGVTGEVHASI